MQNISNNATNSRLTISRNATGVGNVIVETYNTAFTETTMANGRVTLSGNNMGWSGDLIVRQGSAGFGGNVSTSAGNGTNIIIGETSNSLSAGLDLVAFGVNGTMTLNKNITVESGGLRMIRAASDNSYNLSGNILLNGDLTVVNANFFNTHNINLSGNISGAGGLNITESGAAVGAAFTRLSGNNTYLGATTVGANATLSVLSASNNGIGDSSAVSLTAAGALITIGNNETIGSLASTGAFGQVDIGGGFALTTGGTNASTEFSGSITGNGTFIKAGSGIMTVNGTISAANTTVSAGTLLLGSAATLSSVAVVVENGATLNTTALTGGLNIASGRRVGGDGTISGNLSLSSGAQFIFSLTQTLDVTGAVTLDNSFSIGSLVTSSGGAIDWSTVGIGTYTLIGTTTSDFSNIGNFGIANAATVAPGKFAYFQNGSLQLVVIPEPSTFALLALGLASGWVAFRRRKGHRC